MMSKIDVRHTDYAAEDAPRVLIVDDDVVIRAMLRGALERDGYEVSEASNGAHGLAVFKQARPDLVLMDAQMPELDGFEACAALRKLPEGHHTPVMIITGQIDEMSVDRAFGVGAADYITKPVNWAVLKQRVRRMVAQRRAEKYVNYLAYHDALTGLPNRTLFMERLDHAIARAKRGNERLAILFLDLDGFKHINDTLGHDFGDLLLKAVADRLRGCLRESDTVARLGGDEFTILVERNDDEEHIGATANRVLASLTRPFRLGARESFIGASIGIAVYPDHGDDVRGVLKSADMAMYRAKEQGRNNFRFYSSELGANAEVRMSLENNIRRALANREFTVYYQPIAALDTGAISAVEALVRWDHPELGIVPPGDFIGLAEETGLIGELGAWVLAQACADARAMQGLAPFPVRVSVNLSGKQLNDNGLYDVVRRALLDAGLRPELLMLEITENTVMQNETQSIPMLAQLQELGVGLAIDDFGTGYSSLSYLKRLPIDTIKIDRSFVAQVPDDVDDSAIVSAIIAMARQLKLSLVAEGVETEAQLQFLRRKRVERIQGYLLGRPMPRAALLETLKTDPAPLQPNPVETGNLVFLKSAE